MAKNLMADDLNCRLVAALQKEGRISHAELAERLGVSRPTVIDRIKRLEAEGVLAGYSALVTPGLGHQALRGLRGGALPGRQRRRAWKSGSSRPWSGSRTCWPPTPSPGRTASC